MSEIKNLKYRCSMLESRLQRTEAILQNFLQVLEAANYQSPLSCGQCSQYPEQMESGTCGNTDCPHGLN